MYRQRAEASLLTLEPDAAEPAPPEWDPRAVFDVVAEAISAGLVGEFIIAASLRYLEPPGFLEPTPSGRALGDWPPLLVALLPADRLLLLRSLAAAPLLPADPGLCAPPPPPPPLLLEFGPPEFVLDSESSISDSTSPMDLGLRRDALPRDGRPSP